MIVKPSSNNSVSISATSICFISMLRYVSNLNVAISFSCVFMFLNLCYYWRIGIVTFITNPSLKSSNCVKFKIISFYVSSMSVHSVILQVNVPIPWNLGSNEMSERTSLIYLNEILKNSTWNFFSPCVDTTCFQFCNYYEMQSLPDI